MHTRLCALCTLKGEGRCAVDLLTPPVCRGLLVCNCLHTASALLRAVLLHKHYRGPCYCTIITECFYCTSITQCRVTAQALLSAGFLHKHYWRPCYYCYVSCCYTSITKCYIITQALLSVILLPKHYSVSYYYTNITQCRVSTQALLQQQTPLGSGTARQHPQAILPRRRCFAVGHWSRFPFPLSPPPPTRLHPSPDRAVNTRRQWEETLEGRGRRSCRTLPTNVEKGG